MKKSKPMKVLRQYHLDRIRTILDTFYAVAFFTDTIAVQEDLVQILAELDADRTTLTYGTNRASAAHVKQFNAMANANRALRLDAHDGQPPRLRFISSVHAAVGYQLEHCGATVVLCNEGLPNSFSGAAKVSQAHNRVRYVGKNNELVDHPEYTLTYGEQDYA